MTTVNRERTVVAGAVVRVWAGTREVVGGGFLVEPGLIATCASVVADALGTDPRAPKPPSRPVPLDFPLLRPEDDSADDEDEDDEDEDEDEFVPEQVTATVERWSPAGDDGFGGIALLRLADGAAPAGGRMPPLRRFERLLHRSFSVLGFPEGMVDGVWSTGLVLGEPGAWTLKESPGEQRIEAGYSGAPVWDSDSGAVVGMAVTRWGAEAAAVLPINEVLGLDPELLPCPYRGLRPFDEEHAEDFFGRDTDIERLLDTAARRPVVAVAGPSGSGKSSLVRAGLLPRLRASGAEIVYLRADPRGGAAALQAELKRGLPEVNGRVVVLVVDQFEELAAVDPAGARRVLERIVRLTEEARSPVRAVLTLRWSALDELLTPGLLTTLEAGTVLVGPLDRGRLHEAIVRPAERPPGLAFEEGLVTRILDDAGAEPGQLPLVESLLTDLWEQREGGYLTMRDYEAAGGVAGALAQHAERVVDTLPPGDPSTARRLLTALARPDEGGRFVRRPVPLEQLPENQRALVPRLVAGRLLVLNRSPDGAEIVELAHQALIDHWPRLGTWLAEDREFLAWRDRVGVHRDRWEAEGRADTALLRGANLAAANDWLPAREDDLPLTDLDYLRRGTDRQRRDVRRWRLITAVFAVLALGAAGLTVVTVSSGNQVADRLATANADTLGQEAQTRITDDLATATQLALAAYREDPQNAQARTALGAAFLATRSLDSELPGLTPGSVTDLRVGGDTALVSAGQRATVVVGISGTNPRGEELPDVAADRQSRLSPDGRWLAYQTPGTTALHLRDLIARTPPLVMPSPPGTEPLRPVFSPTSDRVAWMQLNGGSPATAELRIWDLRANAEVPNRLGTLGPDTAGVWLTTNPDLALVRVGGAALDKSRLVQRSLVDGSERATAPAGSAVVRGGAAVAVCEPPPPGSTSMATVVVSPVDGAAPLRIPTLGTTCELMLSAESRALVETSSRPTARTGHVVLRLTDLSYGQSYLLSAPVLSVPTASRFTIAQTLELATAGDRPLALLAHGSALLRLRTEPPPDISSENIGSTVTFNNGIHVLRTVDGYAAVEQATGRRLGAVTGVTDRTTVGGADDNSLWNARPVATGWELTRYELPTLARANTFVLPTRSGGPPVSDRGNPPKVALQIEDAADGGRLLTISDGLLAMWDPRTGVPVGKPVPLGESEDRVGFYRSLPNAVPRPAHPGQAVVLGQSDVQIWDVPKGELVTTLPVLADLDPVSAGRHPLLVDAAGERLFVLARDKTLQVWDIDGRTLARPPIPAPSLDGLLGLDADDDLVAVDSDQRLLLLDIASGAEAGSISPIGLPIYLHDDLRTVMVVGPDSQPYDLPVLPEAWRDRLCGLANRPFTPAELAILPPGTNTDPPCS